MQTVIYTQRVETVSVNTGGGNAPGRDAKLVCSQNVHLMFVECSAVLGYIISKKSYGFLHHNMSPVTVLTGQ